MHRRQPIPEALLRLADLQTGVVSREQALGTGFCRAGVERMVRDGYWHRLSSGIYVTTSGEPGWEALAWAGVLIGGDHARIGGLAAAHLHNLQDAAPELITVLVPAANGVPRVDGPWDFRRERPGVRAPRSIGSPPRLSVEDTVLDLACAPGADRTTAVNWITAAVQARLTTVDRLRRAMKRRRFLAQRKMVDAAVVDGFATLRYGHRDVYGTPCEVAWEVGSVLSSRGWPGPIGRCENCQSLP